MATAKGRSSTTSTWFFQQLKSTRSISFGLRCEACAGKQWLRSSGRSKAAMVGGALVGRCKLGAGEVLLEEGDGEW